MGHGPGVLEGPWLPVRLETHQAIAYWTGAAPESCSRRTKKRREPVVVKCIKCIKCKATPSLQND